MDKYDFPTVLDAADLAAFVSLHLKTQPQPLLREKDHRVVFGFDRDITQALAAFYQNAPVPILEYTRQLKYLRSFIFSMRGGAANER